MTQKESEFIATLKKQTFTTLLSAFIMVAGSALAFYFNTKIAVAQNGKEIEILKQEKADRDVYEIQVSEINHKLDRIEKLVDQIK